MADLSILVPVYNKVNTIETVLRNLEAIEGFSYEVIIVDDYSNDGSRTWLERWIKGRGALQAKSQLLLHTRNQGKGAAIKSALAVAKGRYFVVQDADLEYDPGELAHLMVRTDKFRVVYGSRFLGSITGMLPANYVANRFYNFLLRALYGVHITDMHTCYKLIDTKLLRELKLQADGFDYATEVISKLLLRKEPIVEVPISFHGRTVQDGKKIGWRDGLECTADILRYRFPTGLETIRFVMVGAAGFAVNFGFLWVLHGQLVWPLVISQLLAAELAILVSFFLHHNWTYRAYSARRLPLRLLQFNLSATAAALITTGLLWLLVHVTAWNYLFSLAVAALGGLAWNYLFNRHIIWSRQADLVQKPPVSVRR